MLRNLLPIVLLFAAWLSAPAQNPAPSSAPKTGLVHTPDVDLAYWIYGSLSASTTPVIAINGGPGLSHIYMLQNDMWQRVAARRPVVFYDQRGTGASTRIAPNAPMNMDAEVADLEAVRAHLGFPHVDLVGDSFGGLLAIAYAVAHPDRVHKLVLSDSAPPALKDIVHLFPQVFPDLEEQNAASAKKLAASGADAATTAQQQLIDHFRMIFYSPEKREAYLTGAKDLGFNPRVGEAVSQAIANLDLTSRLPQFTFPTLVITGRYDMNVAPLTAWRMYKAIPGAKFVVFEESGHLPSYEEPDKYFQVLTAFLD